MAGLRNGFGLGMGAMLGIVAGVLFLVFACCAGCFGLAIVGAAMDDGRSSALPRPTREQPARLAQLPSAQEPSQPQPVRQESVQIFGINQDAVAGNIRWKVLEAGDLGNNLTSENQFVDPITTQGRFIKVRFEMENRGSDVVHFSDVNLVDSQGRKFKDHSDASIWFVSDQEHCIFEQLNPNIIKTCTMIFEVPLDAHGLKFQAGDLDMFSTAEALVELGL
ncbi:MAG: hypothetical protein FOGNACKC_01986 [Anaerolineae bacterium]|nr:hypothetical protein [Anaerolineae bacterium]